MKRRICIVLSLMVTGCATNAVPVPPPDGYVRAKTVSGCCELVEPRSYNIVLGPALESALREQLSGRTLESPQCWYDNRSDQIMLIAGDLCSGFDEIHFQRTDAAWELTKAIREDPVICLERRR
jgi:hypothetical protein